MRELGTRTARNVQRNRPEGGQNTRKYSRDLGMSKNVTASLTFTASNGRITGANGTFTAFANNDPLLVSGTNKNNGSFTVTGLDAVNSAYLTVSPAPKDEGALTCTVRTS